MYYGKSRTRLESFSVLIGIFLAVVYRPHMVRNEAVACDDSFHLLGVPIVKSRSSKYTSHKWLKNNNQLNSVYKKLHKWWEEDLCVYAGRVRLAMCRVQTDEEALQQWPMKNGTNEWGEWVRKGVNITIKEAHHRDFSRTSTTMVMMARAKDMHANIRRDEYL